LLAVSVEGESEPRVREEIPAASAPERVAPTAPARREGPRVGLELAFAGEAMVTFDPRLRTGLGVNVEARARIPSGPGLLLGLRGGYLRFGCSGPVLADPTVHCAPSSAGTALSPRAAVGVDTFDLGPLVGVWIAPPERVISGYLAFVPQWVMYQLTVQQPDGRQVIEPWSTFATTAMVAGQLRIGGGGLFAALGYRGVTAQTLGLGAIPLGGLLFDLGYRASF
jgi:hypothetical protein